jgi:hypothetical protein
VQPSTSCRAGSRATTAVALAPAVIRGCIEDEIDSLRALGRAHGTQARLCRRCRVLRSDGTHRRRVAARRPRALGVHGGCPLLLDGRQVRLHARGHLPVIGLIAVDSRPRVTRSCRGKWGCRAHTAPGHQSVPASGMPYGRRIADWHTLACIRSAVLGLGSVAPSLRLAPRMRLRPDLFAVAALQVGCGQTSADASDSGAGILSVPDAAGGDVMGQSEAGHATPSWCAQSASGTPCCPPDENPNFCANNAGWTCSAAGTCVLPGDASNGIQGADSGCIAATSGADCTTDEAACQPSVPCCVGYEWFCNSISHTWQKSFLGCPPPPSCGDASNSD